jgi:hypothetical protein
MITSDQEIVNMTTSAIGKPLDRFVEAQRQPGVEGLSEPQFQSGALKIESARVGRGRRTDTRVRELRNRDRQAQPIGHLHAEPQRRSVPGDCDRDRPRRHLASGRTSLKPDRCAIDEFCAFAWSNDAAARVAVLRRPRAGFRRTENHGHRASR